VKRDTIVATLQAIEQDGLTLDGLWADHRRWRKDNAQSVTTPKAYEDVVTSHKNAQLGAGTGERYANEVVGPSFNLAASSLLSISSSSFTLKFWSKLFWAFVLAFLKVKTRLICCECHA